VIASTRNIAVIAIMPNRVVALMGSSWVILIVLSKGNAFHYCSPGKGWWKLFWYRLKSRSFPGAGAPFGGAVLKPSAWAIDIVDIAWRIFLELGV